MSKNHSGHSGCSKCDSKKHDCDCECDVVESREVISDLGPRFCVTVTGDYEVDSNDAVVHVTGQQPGTAPIRITLPCADDPCDSVTIVAQAGTNVVVVGVDGNESTFDLEAGHAATFWGSPGADECTCGTWSRS